MISPRAVLEHLRLYESLQILVPGLCGLLSGPALPGPGLLLLYLVAYSTHVLSVYSYNDYCDFESDAANPRKAADAFKSRRWLGIQTLALTAILLAGLVFMPAGVIVLFVVNQALCMAYSDPRIRLKARLMGSELAHFVAGSSYFMSGVLVAGGAAGAHAIGAVLFGLLYVSGGTFNEIMDHNADKEARLRHLVVRIGTRRSLRLVFLIHYAGFVLIAVYEPFLPVVAACGAGALLYAVATRRLVERIDSPALLLRFRRRYRILFAILLVILSVSRLTHAGGASLRSWVQDQVIDAAAPLD